MYTVLGSYHSARRLTTFAKEGGFMEYLVAMVLLIVFATGYIGAIKK